MTFTTRKKLFFRSIAALGCLCSLGIAEAKLLQRSSAIAGGFYVNTGVMTRPLVGNSHDGGASWFYPTSILTGLPSDVSTVASFTGASCSLDTCIAAGSYQRLTHGTNLYPLLASSSDGGDTWTYPTTITSTLPSNFSTGRFASFANCSGSHCIASGQYTNTSNMAMPLVAVSHNAGVTWNYPATIRSNLPSDFMGLTFFNGSTCHASNCIVTGQYQNTALTFYPLVGHSANRGRSWTYPSSIITNLPLDFSTAGLFNAVSCSAESCVAAGGYTSTNAGSPIFPLVATSHDNGATWFYPSSVKTQLPTNFNTSISLSDISCNALNCIAVGQYQSTLGVLLKYPLLLSSQDGGDTWNYPKTIISNLPLDFTTSAMFNGATCNRNICIAVGQYQSTLFGGQAIPLVANSLDGGKTWNYPVTSTTTLPINADNGVLNSVSCNVDDCTAKGQYQSKNSGLPFFPLVATSHDAGKTWTYPDTVVINLPLDYSDHGVFNGGDSSFDSGLKIKH